MNIGNKIQLYRKQHNLSQEDLAKKLNLSRQTVSQWETSQTIPSIDNLIRLSELFSVSVDELIKDESEHDTTHTQEIETPRETYTFNFDNEDEKEITKNSRAPFVRGLVVFLVTFALAGVYLFSVTTANNYFISFSLGILFFGIFIYVRSITTFNRRQKAAFSRVKLTTYAYELFSDHMIQKLYRNDDLICTQKIYYKDITNGTNTYKHITFAYANQLFFVRKSNLVQNSIFYNFVKTNTGRIKQPQKADNFHRTFSIVLFVATLLAMLLAMTLVGYVTSKNYYVFTDNLWLFFLFTPISIGSVVYGFILKKKGYKYKKNVIAGIIVTVLLCLYGSFTFIFSDIYTHSDEPIQRVEQTLNIDLPQHAQINTNTVVSSFKNGRNIYSSDVFFEDENVEEFEKELRNSDLWLSSVPNDLNGLMSPYFYYSSGDYVIIYNITTDEANTLPESNGTYTFLSLSYSPVKNQMLIIEYILTYQSMGNSMA